MKSLTKRNLLFVLLSVVVALCSLTFAATVKPAKAATAIDWSTATFEVMEEASIRIGKDADTGVVGGAQSGLRFRARVDANTYAALTEEGSTAYMGFLITPKQLYDDRAADANGAYGKDDYINSISNYVGDQGTGIIVTKGFYEEDGYYYANAAVNNMIEKNIKLDFTAVAYIYDGAEYHYSVPSEDFSRTYKQVANAAVLSGRNDIEVVRKAQYLSTLGTSDNPIILRNQEDFDTLASANASGNDFSGVTCALYADASISVDCTDEFFANYAGNWKATATPVKKNHTATTVETEGTIPTATTGCTLDKIVCTACGETVQDGVEVASGLNYTPAQSDIGEPFYYNDGSDTQGYTGGIYKVTSRTYIDYFEAGELPTTFTYGTTTVDIANEYNYNGPAIRVRSESSSRGLEIEMPYTGEQYKAYAQENGYDTVKVWMAVNASKTMTATKYMLGAFGTERQQWKCLILTIDEFVATFGTMTCAEGNSNARVFTADPTKNTIIYRLETYSDYTWEFLIGNIEFIAHSESQHTPLTEATCTKQAVCAICYQPYGELAAHTEGTPATCSSLATCSVCGNEYGDYVDHDEETTIPAVNPTATTAGNTAEITCSVCDQILQESVVLPALNYTPAESDVGVVKGYKNDLPTGYTGGNYSVSSNTWLEYYAAGSLPTQMANPAGTVVVDIDNTAGYAGPAIRVQTSNSGRGLKVTMPYTGEQYKTYMEANGYDAVKIWMCVATNKTLSGDTGTMLNVFGSARNKWAQVTLTKDKFLGTFGTMTKAEGSTMSQVFTNVLTENTIIYRTQKATSGTWAIYVGTMEFVSTAA